MKATAVTNSNIALVKYWGRLEGVPKELNIPMNDNVSMTKSGGSGGSLLRTRTTVEFGEDIEGDSAVLNGEPLTGRGLQRVVSVADNLREAAGSELRFRMESKNDFPTAAGLASSAAGFAALTLAGSKALSLDMDRSELSTYARLGSGSACRSLFGGFVYWHRGADHSSSMAEKIRGSECFRMEAVIAIVGENVKEVPSEVGHGFARTSPFNGIRADISQRQAKEVVRALLDDDFKTVGEIAEKNCRYMHAVMMTSDIPLYYWSPDTLEVIKLVHRIRKGGIETFFTIDAGPNVHCLCRPEDTDELRKELDDIPCVKRTIPVRPAEDPFFTEDHLF